MALVTIGAVVYVPLHARMFRVGLRLGVAVGALEDREVVGIRVAIAADAVGIAVVQREIWVIESGVRPLDVVMTVSAGRGEMRGGVVRIIGIQIIRFMAAVTVCRQIRVVVV